MFSYPNTIHINKWNHGSMYHICQAINQPALTKKNSNKTTNISQQQHLGSYEKNAMLCLSLKLT